MRFLLLVITLIVPLAAAAQSERNVDNIRLPQCEKVSDLKQALSRVERFKGFTRGDDYKFLKGFGKKCGRYKIRSRSNYKLHSYHDAGDNIFVIYEVTGGQGYEGGKRVGFVANSIYSKGGWRIARGRDCVLTASGGGCLLPKRCRSLSSSSNSGYFQKVVLDEFAAPAHCYGMGEED
ncbi:MAG: hypothetical protein AAF991_13730 [Pseudomonadota bacterium]